MCSKLADNIITFNVSGVPIKISTDMLAKHPESLLTTMVDNKVQPAEGFFVKCCPKIFGYILRFVIHGLQVDPVALSEKLVTSEVQVRKVIDRFKFKGIYTSDCVSVKVDNPKENHTLKQEAEELYGDVWSIAEKGELAKLQLIIAQKLNLEVRCKQYGSTPLMYAAQNGRLDCVQFLIDQGANVNTLNNDKLTALHFATDSNNIEVIKLLIKQGANLNAPTRSGYTPLYRAIDRNADISIIKCLLKNGVAVNFKENTGMTPLHLASQKSTLEVITELIKRGADVNAKTQIGSTALHFAAMRSLNIVKYLLKMGADPHVKRDGDTPLLIASKAQKHDIVAELAEHMVSSK